MIADAVDGIEPDDTDGLDLDAEGRDAREISSGFAHGRDRQPDFAGRDL